MLRWAVVHMLMLRIVWYKKWTISKKCFMTCRTGSSVLYVGPQGSNQVNVTFYQYLCFCLLLLSGIFLCLGKLFLWLQDLPSPSFLGLDTGTPRLLGLDTGNPAADGEAEMWIMALIGTIDFSSTWLLSRILFLFPFCLGVLAAAIPVAFLNPSLGFRKRRSVEEGEEEIFEKLRFAQRGVQEGEEVFNSWGLCKKIFLNRRQVSWSRQ